MKYLIKIVGVFITVLLVNVFPIKTAMAQDVVKVAPQSYKVLLENDRVRVLEYRLEPGVKEPMHSHPDYIVYAFSAVKAMITLPDGKTVERQINVGEAVFLVAETHTVENTGTTESHGLIIELKEPQRK